MKCSICGREIADDVRFCPYCGAELINQPTPEFKPVQTIDEPGYDYEQAYGETNEEIDAVAKELEQEVVHSTARVTPVNTPVTAEPPANARVAFSIVGFILGIISFYTWISVGTISMFSFLDGIDGLDLEGLGLPEALSQGSIIVAVVIWALSLFFSLFGMISGIRARRVKSIIFGALGIALPIFGLLTFLTLYLVGKTTGF